MMNFETVKMDYCRAQMRNAYTRNYSDMERELGNVIVWSSHLALEILANSDALYHNVDHTMMVTLAGQAILEGKHLAEGGVSPKDWAHVMIALLCHDVGYVKGVCKGDQKKTFMTGIEGKSIELEPCGTDAAWGLIT